jgi:hypothetical protein
VDHDRRGTGIVVASNMEATDSGKRRSFEEDDEEDLRDETAGLYGVRDRASRCTGVREPRFGGITTGVVIVEPGRSACLVN